MKQNLTRKIIAAHLVEGSMTAGSEVAVRIDQTLTQDATGTMAYLQWEAIGLPRVKTEVSVSYVDHNTLQMGFRNPDDHRYLRIFRAESESPRRRDDGIFKPHTDDLDRQVGQAWSAFRDGFDRGFGNSRMRLSKTGPSLQQRLLPSLV